MTFTVYQAAAPGWAYAVNQTTLSALSMAVASRTVTLTVAAGTNFAVGHQISVSGITGTFSAGTNCTALSGSLFNGTYTISAVAATTISFVDANLPTNCTLNISAARASGSVADNTKPTLATIVRTAPTATALSCTIGPLSGPSSTFCSDSIHTVMVNPGDLISVVARSSRTTGIETIGNLRVSLEKQ
jgi:hypothetical protein